MTRSCRENSWEETTQTFSPSEVEVAYHPNAWAPRRRANRAKWPNRGRNLKKRMDNATPCNVRFGFRAEPSARVSGCANGAFSPLAWAMRQVAT